MKRLSKELIVAAIAGTAAAACLAFLQRGDFVWVLVSVSVAVYAAPALIAMALIAFGLSRAASRPGLAWAAVICLAGADVCILQAGSPPLGRLLQRRDVRRARSFRESLVPLLETHMERHGGYPKSIGEVWPRERPLPRLLRDQRSYWPDGASFRFEFEVPDGFLGAVHVYDGRSGRWQEHT
jgi:hypothetical protein